MTELALILVTAVLTSACTLGLGWYVFQQHLRERLQAVVDAQAEEIGEMMRERVSEGVQDGIKAALVDLPNHAARTAARSATQTSMDFVSDAAKFWFGERKDR